MPPPTIAIIGAGFSGTSLSLWLQATSPPGTRILLIDTRAGSQSLAPMPCETAIACSTCRWDE
jgi:2-polyprenyl-6-methoxyphenol hydroxylase-like FAD-dependent oxidoreductase